MLFVSIRPRNAPRFPNANRISSPRTSNDVVAPEIAAVHRDPFRITRNSPRNCGPKLDSLDQRPASGSDVCAAREVLTSNSARNSSLLMCALSTRLGRGSDIKVGLVLKPSTDAPVKGLHLMRCCS